MVPQRSADALTLAEGRHRLLCHSLPYSQRHHWTGSQEPKNKYYSASYRAVAFKLFFLTVAIASTFYITSKCIYMDAPLKVSRICILTLCYAQWYFPFLSFQFFLKKKSASPASKIDVAPTVWKTCCRKLDKLAQSGQGIVVGSRDLLPYLTGMSHFKFFCSYLLFSAQNLESLKADSWHFCNGQVLSFCLPFFFFF